MFDMTYEFDADVLGAWISQLQQTPRAVNTFLQKTVVGHIQREVDAKITPKLQAVGPVVYGQWPEGAWIQWKSRRQRRFVHANILKHDAQGNTIPYSRTGALAAGMKVELDLATGTISIVNRAPGAIFTIGEYQQPFHRNTGHPDITEDAFNIFISANVENMLIEGWVSIVDIPTLI